MPKNENSMLPDDYTGAPDPSLYPPKEQIWKILDQVLELQRRGIIDPPPPDVPDQTEWEEDSSGVPDKRSWPTKERILQLKEEMAELLRRGAIWPPPDDREEPEIPTEN